MSHHDFRYSLAESLLLSAVNAVRPAKRGRKTSNCCSRLAGRHFPVQIPGKAGSKRKVPLPDCKACNPPKRKRKGYSRKQTSYMCQQCDIPICITPCFQVYHTVTDYKCALLTSNVSSDSESDCSSELKINLCWNVMCFLSPFYHVFY